MSATGIGAAVRRKEDFRFITGKGQYTDDMAGRARPARCSCARRTPTPRSRASMSAAAKAMPGVVAVLTGAELATDKIGNLICGWMIHSKDGTPMKMSAHPALAAGKVCYVGDPVAVVIAETMAQGKDAAEKVKVDYEVLPAVIDPAKAQAKARRRSTRSSPNNTIYQWHLGDAKAADAAFAAAKHVTKLDIVNNRLVPNAMEPRVAIGEYDAGTDHLTLWNTSQNPHVARLVIAAFVGMAPEHKLRVIAPDVGGGFGSKIFIYPEEVVCLWASHKVEPSGEMDLATARKRSSPTRMAATTSRTPRWRSTPTARSWRCAPRPSPISAPTCRRSRRRCRPISTRTLLSGQYDIPAIYCEVDAVYTNTVPVDAYRGAGRPEATFVVERLVEVSARARWASIRPNCARRISSSRSRTRRR